MEIEIPGTSLIVLCGVAGCGKSTFALKNFKETEIVSSDRCRALLSDDEENMEISREAFELFYYLIDRRMKLGRLIVADSTAVNHEARKKLLDLANQNNYYSVLLAFDVPIGKAVERNNSRTRKVSEDVIEKQQAAFSKSLNYIEKEGFDKVVILNEQEIQDFKHEIMPYNIEVKDNAAFDIISDVHGCCTELEMLLKKLGYVLNNSIYAHPEGRKVVFSGDIVDRGPRSMDAINIVVNMVASLSAYYIPGNHCNKFYRYLNGRKVQVKNGLETTVKEYERLDKPSAKKIKNDFIKLYESSPAYIILDGGRLVVAHAGIKEEMIGKMSKKITDFVLYGDVSGEVDKEGLPVRGDWAADYCGKSLIVYGHTPVSDPVFVNNTINIDQGASMGGSLTALRYPEKELVSVKSLGAYYTSGRQRSEIDKEINLHDYSGSITLRDMYDHKLRIERWEVKGAVDALKPMVHKVPWIIYVPPVVPGISSDSIESQLADSIKYYREKGFGRIIVEPRFSNSSCVVIICRDNICSSSYFSKDRLAEAYSLYNNVSPDKQIKYDILKQLQVDMVQQGYFEKYNTEFLVVECEIVSREGKISIIPLKLISHSCSTFEDKDNIWQMESVDRLCSYSGLFNRNYCEILENDMQINSLLSKFQEQRYNSYVIKTEKYRPDYRGRAIQPEILCAAEQLCTGEDAFRLSTYCYDLSDSGLNRFIKKKLSKKYFEYVLGAITVNNKMIKMKV